MRNTGTGFVVLSHHSLLIFVLHCCCLPLQQSQKPSVRESDNTRGIYQYYINNASNKLQLQYPSDWRIFEICAHWQLVMPWVKENVTFLCGTPIIFGYFILSRSYCDQSCSSHVSMVRFSGSFARCRCCEWNFNYPNCLSSRTCSTRWPQVGLCPIFLVFLDLFRLVGFVFLQCFDTVS